MRLALIGGKGMLAQAVMGLVPPGYELVSFDLPDLWHEFAAAIVEEARAAGETIVAQRVVPIRTEEYPLPAPRPAWSVFSKEKYKAATGATVPDWRKSLKEYFRNRQEPF